MSDEFQPRLYLDLFQNWQSVNGEFHPGRWYDDVSELERQSWLGEEPEFIFAYYKYEDYSGDSTVVFKKDGKWFLNSAGHCSFYGLEGKWEPEEFDPAEHFLALDEGKRVVVVVYDYYGREPSELNAKFDNWLAKVWCAEVFGTELVTGD